MTMPRLSAPGPFFPFGRFRLRLLQPLPHFGDDIFMWNAWPGIVYRGLKAALQQLFTQIDMRLQFLMLAEDHKYGFGWIEEFPLFDPVEQP